MTLRKKGLSQDIYSIIFTLTFIFLNLTISEVQGLSTSEEHLISEGNCTPPAIDDFPTDIFTQKERRHGYVIIHILASAYIFYLLAVVCDEYFVPSIECICEEFNVPNDVAGASFMAIATSCPELFTNVIGTFLTEGDIGVGTIVGSAMFNVLGVCAVCGFFSRNPLPLEWYPLTRDILVYSISVILLIIFMNSRRVYWYEALVLVITYLLYIFVMYKNTTVRKWAEKALATIQTNQNHTTIGHHEINYGTVPNGEVVTIEPTGILPTIQIFLTWPSRTAFRYTLPDCRGDNQKEIYPLTFCMCIVWIGVLSFLVNWTVTVIGHTLLIPDSVMGLTFIAAGSSIPEAVSSYIVSRQGYGTMSISNAMGSNSFDILVCLGVPWLIRGCMIANNVNKNFVQINSSGLNYSVIMLLFSLITLYLMLAKNRFILDRKVGLISLGLYANVLLLACLVELNVFGEVNLPTCKSIYE